MSDIKQSALIGTIVMIVGIIIVTAINFVLLKNHPVYTGFVIAGAIMTVAGFFVSRSS
jgi:hypothetical protein